VDDGNSAGVQSAKIRAKKEELHMVEEQNSAVYDHRAISYAPAGFHNYSRAKVQRCSFAI
jgi:hypothetical protein